MSSVFQTTGRGEVMPLDGIQEMPMSLEISEKQFSSKAKLNTRNRKTHIIQEETLKYLTGC